eukprot:889753-Pyramimonas_sp.AAC.1
MHFNDGVTRRRRRRRHIDAHVSTELDSLVGYGWGYLIKRSIAGQIIHSRSAGYLGPAGFLNMEYADEFQEFTYKNYMTLRFRSVA